MTHTHTGHPVRHVRCGRPVHARAFRTGPTHALTVGVDRVTYSALCGETVRMGSGEVPNVISLTSKCYAAEPVTCEACRALIQ